MIKAFAKINLFLDVTGKRDDGYHNILTLFQEIDLADLLVLKKKRTKGLSIKCSLQFERENILAKVWRLIEEKIGPLPYGCEVILTKKIPVGAGLGGGSSDAAYFLKAACKMFNISASEEKLEEWISSIGSDCSFFIKGGCQVAEQKGEKLKVFSYSIPLWFLIIYPGFLIKTEEAYKRLDEKSFGKGREKFSKLCEALLKGDLRGISDNMYNVFDETTFSIYPDLFKTVKRLREEGALKAMLCGSGSAIFGLFSDKESAKKAYRSLKNYYPFIRITQKKK